MFAATELFELLRPFADLYPGRRAKVLRFVQILAEVEATVDAARISDDVITWSLQDDIETNAVLFQQVRVDKINLMAQLLWAISEFVRIEFCVRGEQEETSVLVGKLFGMDSFWIVRENGLTENSMKATYLQSDRRISCYHPGKSPPTASVRRNDGS